MNNFIVIFALITIARASVIVNVYEDGDNKASHSVRDTCNYQACDQLCRRLGFPGGACVGDKCKCDNFQPMHIQSKVLQYLLLPSSKHSSDVESCDLPSCNRMCKQYGYEGGFCRGSDCFCYKNKRQIVNKALDNLMTSSSKHSAAVESCDVQTCDNMCKMLGYDKGLCRGSDCFCIKQKQESDENISNNLLRSPLIDYSCNDGACNWWCKIIGYPEGKCFGNDCYCRKNEGEDKNLVHIAKIGHNDEIDNNIVNDKDTSPAKIAKDKNVSDCDYDPSCMLTCTNGGFCVSDICICF